MVDPTGIEPVASWLQTRRSPIELRARIRVATIRRGRGMVKRWGHFDLPLGFRCSGGLWLLFWDVGLGLWDLSCEAGCPPSLFNRVFVSFWREPWPASRSSSEGSEEEPGLVGVGRLELPTFRLSGECSSQLSYTPPWVRRATIYGFKKGGSSDHSSALTRGLSGSPSMRGPIGTMRWKMYVRVPSGL